MESESHSDSDASHISSTPPTSPKSKPQKPKPKNPKKSKPKYPKKPKSDPNPLPPSPPSDPPFASPDISSLHGLPVKRIRNQPDPIPSSSSFSSLFKSRRPNFDFSSEIDKVDNFTAIERIPNKPKKVRPNFIATSDNLPSESSPRLKLSNEGNFVRLNINGYGRKYSFRNGHRKYPSKSKRFHRRRFVKGKNEVEECNDDGYWMEGKEMDFEAEKALEEVRREVSDENLRGLLKVVYGYDEFREGQLETIKRVVGGESMMLVLPTGAGKSLCYQLPALILPGLTLVVSPLIALMVDQLRHLPPVIPGALLSSNQTIEEASETLHRLREGNIKVLFVSPERFLNAEFTSMFGDLLSISLLVIDEAHCISEWSHNFRPSFLRLRASLLRSKLNVQCFLAMTATATAQTLRDIMCALEILPGNLIQTCQIRENLQLFVTLSENRLKDLLMLMKSSPVVDMRSIIIYCKFQAETDMVSKYLCDNNIPAKGYHSGMLAKSRSHILELFCSNKLRVVVATVAFGMGLDKSDVEAVIHYSLPESLEEYIQETGRAGRDGRLSRCHLFLDNTTYYKLRSLSYSDGVDEYAISKLLSHIFSNDVELPGIICFLIKESASQNFDMKEEVILTILTQLELGDVPYICLLPQLNVTCSVYFHKTSPALLSDKEILVADILKKSEIKNGHYVFNTPTLANDAAISTTALLKWLQNLKHMGEITYDLKDPAFCFMIVKKPDDIFFLTTKLAKWLSEVERCKIRKLDEVFNVASFAVKECKKIGGCSDSMHSPCIQRKIADYFNRDDNASCNDLSSRLPRSRCFFRVIHMRSSPQELLQELCMASLAQLFPLQLGRNAISGTGTSELISILVQSQIHERKYKGGADRILLTRVSLQPIDSEFPFQAVNLLLNLSIKGNQSSFLSLPAFKGNPRGRYMEIDFPVVMEAAAVELMDFVKKGNIHVKLNVIFDL